MMRLLLKLNSPSSSPRISEQPQFVWTQKQHFNSDRGCAISVYLPYTSKVTSILLISSKEESEVLLDRLGLLEAQLGEWNDNHFYN